MKIKTLLEAELSNGSRTVYFGNDKVGDSVVQSVYIQVCDDVAVSLTGTTVFGQDEVAVGAIALADFSKVDSITEEGIYMVVSEPLHSLTLTTSGTVDVVVKAVG